MADNILGLLFITSSSSGRNVFRYPPDPTSTVPRLSQPIYPSATYTARDTTVDIPTRKKLFGSQLDATSKASSGGQYTDRRKSSNNSARSSALRLSRHGRYTGGSSDGAGSRWKGIDVSPPLGVNGDFGSDEFEDEDDEASSSSGDSDYDGLYDSGGPSRNRAMSSDDEGEVKNGKKGNGDIRRDSTSKDGETHVNGDGQKKPERDKYIEDQYTSSMGYTLDFLSDMLTPPRAACNRKFEIVVDELVFIGHPVVIGKNGQWGPSEAEDDDEEDSRRSVRGRKMRDPPSGLGTVAEHGEPTVRDPSMPATRSNNTKREDSPPLLTMFHLVLILDKPDPQPGLPIIDGPSPGMYDEAYWEIAYKWTAAALLLQSKDNWVARESWEIAKMREQCMNDGIPVIKCLQMVIEKTQLARSLNQLYNAIHHLRTTPINPLYAHLPTTLTVNVADIPVNIVVSPKSTDADEAWAQWGEVDDLSSSESEESEGDYDEAVIHSVSANPRAKPNNLRVEPWQTLLMINEEPAFRNQISSELMGLGIGVGNDRSEIASPGDQIFTADSRRDSVHTAEEEDERLLMKALIQELTVTKPLAEMAHVLRYDLDGIVIPLAKELVQNKRAILIEVINLRLRSIVMPTTIAEHATTFTKYSFDFQKAFPDLPPLPSFISLISSSPVPLVKHLPPNANDQIRQLWMSALIWLLKHDLVVQVHTRARIFASPEVKDQAWRNLWHRRRKRWLEVQERNKNVSSKATSQVNTPSVNALELVTPRANDINNPLERELITVPPPQNGLLTLENSHEGYDPDLEMDSDLGEGEDDHSRLDSMEFSVNVDEPENVPKFTASVIFRPAKAQKDEARWLRVIRESGDDVSASKFDLCVQYLDGVTTYEEMSYRTGLNRRELDRVLGFYKDHLIIFLHP